MSATRQRCGRVTWVTALVVLGVAGLAAGLLLSAVSKVREAPARLVCANHMKQMALAVRGYEETHGTLPTGTMPNAALPPEQRLSWHVAILPYVEQRPTFDRVDSGLAWDAAHNRWATTQSVRVYACPTLADRDAPVTTYTGVAGVGPDAATLDGTDLRVGVFGYDRVTKSADLKDGRATTLLLLESGPGRPWAQGGPGTVRGLDPADRPYLGPGRPFAGHAVGKSWFARGSFGGNVASVDGSVRYVTDSVSPDVLEAFATIAGGESVPAEW